MPTASSRPCFDVTEIAVAHFNSAVGKSGETIDRLDVGRASDITRKTATSPTSLVLALIYLERLRLVLHCWLLLQISPLTATPDTVYSHMVAETLL